ncbi:transcription factor Adf-1 [Ceratitis capitata]|uniref:Transcription factor Adf-1 n=1 Tax=Ceratitis capitata TaxID=7213 RepID=W8BWT2_CERCA|nr:transcription factor Adf-1 [Ceratitis capitata]
MDMEKFIDCVKAYPCLYDKGNRHYKSLEKRKNAWRELAEASGTDEFEVERHWKNLRDRFSREIRKKTSSWRLLKNMEFLRIHVIPRPIGVGDPRLDNDFSISSTQSNPNPYDSIDRAALIRLVKEHECLYNRYYVGYKSSDRKKKAWRQIASAMGIDKEQCMQQWVALRDRYGREMRRITALNNNGMSPEHVWPFYDSLQFLRPHILPRCRNNSAPFQSTKNPTENVEFVVEQENTTDSYEYDTDPFQSKALCEQEIDQEDIDDISNQQQIASTSKRKYESDVEQELCSALDLFKQVCGRIKVRNQNPIVQGFGQMIVETICSMSERKQALAMQKVTELVMNIKMQPEIQ